MIVGRYAIHDVAKFAADLTRAARGVVHIGIERAPSQGSATGWLITEDLVVLPEYALSDATDAEVQYTFETGGNSGPAELVFGSPGNPEAAAPALLRLARALDVPILEFAPAQCEPGDPVFVIQYPGDRAEPGFSTGRVLELTDTALRYDADTEAGSAGAPILDRGWAVVGMHMAASPDPAAPYNEGRLLATLIEAFRSSPQWPEIARRHDLVDVTAVQRSVETREDPMVAREDLVAAAVHWRVDPKTLSDEVAATLELLVADPRAPEWILPASERAELLQSAGSLEELQRARGTDEVPGDDQKVIDRILRGPPYLLEEIADSDLPYWLQATRWFAGIEPTLPTPAEINRELERRRLRSRLDRIAGAPFRGREAELAALAEWHGAADPGPKVIRGVGGVGKSAIVAQFARRQPAGTLLLWLDFDRADLAPDDAVSVLQLLFEQLTVQLDGFVAPPLDAKSWPQAVRGLGKQLDPLLRRAPPPFLVLDGFEVAQYAVNYAEIWRLLEQLLAAVPDMRILVSGRARVGDVALLGRKATELTLTGLEDDVARSWLRDAGLTDEHVIARVAEICQGVPLKLRLAVLWSQQGGGLSEVPEDLPERLVEGFLYQRILDRVIDKALRPLAADVLVVRRLTPQMLGTVFADRLPDGMEAPDVFARLPREMALVDTRGPTAAVVSGTNVLQLRPELRAATLDLLELDAPERVAAIDARAAAWYSEQTVDELSNAAELVYHRLRLNDVEGAKQAWRPGCERLLDDAEDELPEDARSWLRGELASALTRPEVEAWEFVARERVQALLARGLVQRVPPLLAEWSVRSPGSSVLVYDAWIRWRSEGDPAGALKLLDEAPPAKDSLARERALLAAGAATALDHRQRADAELKRLGEAEEPGSLVSLALTAARIRLTVDLATEVKLARELETRNLKLVEHSVLRPSDVLLPQLAERLGGAHEASAYALRIPRTPDETKAFIAELVRIGAIRDVPGAEPQDRRPIHRYLGHAATRRWRLAACGTFLAGALDVLYRSPRDPLAESIAATLVAVAGDRRGAFVLVDDKGTSVASLLERMGLQTPSAPVTKAQQQLARSVEPLVDAPTYHHLELLIASPDPAELVLRRTLGIPDSYSY